MFDQAIAASDDLARRGHSTGYLALLKGRAHFGLKRYREARASFEVAVRLDPQNPDARLFLDQVNGILGQGNNYSITAEIQPVPLPESLVDSQLPTEIPAGFKDSGAYYLRHSTAIHYRKGHPAKITTRFIVKILDQSGVNSFSAVQWGFNPLSETVYLNDITVRDERGEILAKVSRDQCYVIDARNATFERAFNAPVPGLRPGVAISATFTKQSLGKLDHPRFWEYLMCQWSPTLDSIVAVTGDVDDVEVIGPQSLSRQDFPGGIAFRFSNAPAIRYERFQPVLEYFVPTIAIGPKDRPWADEVRDYLKEIDPRLAIDETTKQFARDAIKGAKTDLEKTRALSRAVQNKVRYVALEFGRRGIIPNTPRETIANAYGDCKDASVLLKACLDSSGIPALLALAAPGRQHYPELTSLDQFTHMLVYVPSLKMFLDPTDKNVDLTLQPPGALLDSDALILDADPKFLPVHNPSAKFVNRLEIQRDVSFNEQNDVLIKDTTRFIGFAASGFRGLFSQIAAPEHLPEARDIFGRRLPNLVLTDVKIQNLDDVAQPLIIATSLASAKPAARDGKFPLPVVWEDFVLGADSNTDRRTPFTFKPADVQIVTTIKTPKAPREKVEPVTSKFGEARLAFAHTNGVLTATATVNLEGGRHPAADYPEYNRFITAAESLLTTAIDLAAPPKATAANR